MALVLASASPRRRELLPALGVPFEVVPSGVDEGSQDADPARLACALALRKARAVAEGRLGDLVIGADTIVVLDGRPLGKPGGPAEARAMLKALRDRTHEVVTGVAAVTGPGAAFEGVESTRTLVTMRDYSDAEIAAYIERGEPYDKAGGYAIQDEALAPAAATRGCRCAVIGLPLWTLRGLMQRAGLESRAPDLEPGLERCATCPLREPPSSA